MSEGYDPLRLITAQANKANILLVLDTSAEMGKAVDGTTASTSSCNAFFTTPTYAQYCHSGETSGQNPDASVAPAANPQTDGQYGSATTTSVVDWPGGISWIRQASGCNNQGTRCTVWNYALQFMPPSRMAYIKNALGSSVTLMTTYTPPSVWPSYNSNWTAGTVSTATGSNTSVFTVTFGGQTQDPGTPFTSVAYDTSNHPNSGFGSFNLQSPQDLIGTTASYINWGLSIYPTTTADASLSCANGEATIAVPIDTTDSCGSGCKNINVIEALLKKSSDSTCLDPTSGGTGTCSGNSASGYLYYGLGASGSTTSVAALEYTKTRLKTVYEGGSSPWYAAPSSVLNVLKYNGNSSSACQYGLFGGSSNCSPTSIAVTADPKTAGCTREYAVLHASAGTATVCNNGDNTNTVGWSVCTNSSPAITGYSPGVAEEITNITLTNGNSLGARVWVLGPSELDSSTTRLCELNRTAYSGKTDAGDAASSYDFDNDTRLTTYTADYGYAFYATTAPSDLITAINTVYAPGSGDYPTAEPIALASSILQLATDTQVLLASTGYPNWHGHLRLIDYAQQNPSDQIQWDAGENLVTPTVNNTTNPKYVSPANRKIYTWNTSNTLVSVESGNINALKTIAQAYGMTAQAATDYITDQFIDYIRGGDGTATGTLRCWTLGPIVNSTPAVIADPPTFSNFKSTAEDHTNFTTAYTRTSTVVGNTTTYGGRAPLVWVGSDDGMVHAFALTESSSGADDAGREVIAILPPNMFQTVYDQYYNYVTYTTGCSDVYQTGQPTSTSNHLYGVANSMRFADIYDASGSSTNSPANNYRTVMYLTEGPGGDMIAAIDVTHPTSGDPGYNSSTPVTVLWSYTGSTGPNILTGLYKSWSIPAIGATTGTVAGDTWYAVFGSGQNPASTASSSVNGTLFTLNALTGASINSTTTPNNATAPTNIFVGSQFFTNSVLYQRSRNGQKFDDVMDAAVQGTLFGRVIPLTGPTFTDNRPSSIIDAFDLPNIGVNQHVAPTATDAGDYNVTTPTISASQSQPLYYSPAVSGIRSATGCTMFTFGSGAISEKSSNINGSNTGTGTTGTNFIPSIFGASRPKSSSATTAIPGTSIVRTALASVHKVVKGVTTALSGQDISPNCTSIGGDGCLSASTQLSGPPIIAVPLSDTDQKGKAIGLFVVYDPAVSYKTCNNPSIDKTTNVRTCTSDNTITECTGNTFVIFQTYAPNVDANGDCQVGAPTVASTNAYYVGAGISSGIAIGKGNILLVARSGSGTGAATVVQTTSIPPVNPGGSGNVTPTWWQERK